MISFSVEGIDLMVDQMMEETYRMQAYAIREAKDVAMKALETLVKETPQWTGNFAANWEAYKLGEGGGGYDELSAKQKYAYNPAGSKEQSQTFIDSQRKAVKLREFPRRKGEMSNQVGANLSYFINEIVSMQFNRDRPGLKGIVIANSTPYGEQVFDDRATDNPYQGAKYIRKVNYYGDAGPITLTIATRKAVFMNGGHWNV